MSIKVETKAVTETTVTITMNEETSQQLEAVLRNVKFYTDDGESTGFEDLEGLYEALSANYDSSIVDGRIVLEKF